MKQCVCPRARSKHAWGQDQSGGQGKWVYRGISDAYFQGKVQALYPGVYKAGDLTIGTSTLSSLRVPDGWQAALYKAENCVVEGPVSP